MAVENVPPDKIQPSEENNTGNAAQETSSKKDQADNGVNNNEEIEDADRAESTSIETTVQTTSCCTVVGCTREVVPEKMIKCDPCKRFTHFACTQLPGYQLAQLMTKGYRKYVCAACYGDIDEAYIDTRPEVAKSSIESQTGSAWTAWSTLKKELGLAEENVSQLKEENEILKNEKEQVAQNLIVVHAELDRVNDCVIKEKKECSRIKNHFNAKETEMSVKAKELRECEKENKRLDQLVKSQQLVIANTRKNNTEMNELAAEALISEKNIEIEELKAIITKLQAEGAEYENSLRKYEESESDLRKLVSARDSDLKEQEKKFDEAGNPDFDNLMNLETCMKKQIQLMGDSIKESLRAEIQANNKQIDMKLNQAMLFNNSLVEEVNDVTSITEPSEKTDAVISSYAGMLKIPEAVKKAIHDERIEKKQEESDIDRRKKNFIIHNADEVGANHEELKKQDLGFVKEIFDKLGITSQPKMVMRLGETNENKKRPLKVVMKSTDDQIKVMKNLGLLKNTEDQVGKISVREDHTQSEREEINTLVKKAKENSDNDKERIWKVRGDPRSKNGLRLVSFIRNQ